MDKTNKTYTESCSSSDLHPYNCEGEGNCIHCDQLETAEHKPSFCVMCNDIDIDDLLLTDEDME